MGIGGLKFKISEGETPNLVPSDEFELKFPKLKFPKLSQAKLKGFQGKLGHFNF